MAGLALYLLLGLSILLLKANKQVAAQGPWQNELEQTDGLFYELAVVFAGIRAVRMLLKGGKPVHTDKKFRVFEKRGSMEKALLDFYSVGPTDVLPFKVPGQGYGTTGVVGDRQLILKSVGETGKPTLDVIKVVSRQDSKGKKEMYGKITERITYKD